MILSDITVSVGVCVRFYDSIGNKRFNMSVLYFAVFRAVRMASGLKSCDENLVGCRVKVWWPKDKSLRKLSSYFSSFFSLLKVVCTHGVEQILKPRKKDYGEPLPDVLAHEGTEKHGPAHASSRMPPETDNVKDHGEELVGCSVKVWRSKSKTFSEGVVASYDLSCKKHLVVYTNGVEEMLNLRNHRETAEDISADQAQKARARDSSSIGIYILTGGILIMMLIGTRQKSISSRCVVVLTTELSSTGFDFDLLPAGASPVLSKNQKVPKLEVGIEPIDPKLSAVLIDDGLVNINGYKVKSATATVLEAIFAKYGDIAAHCLYKSTSVKASLLEVICNIVQRLQFYDFEAILSDLEAMENEVSDVEASKIKVSWLQEHLANVRKVAAFREKSFQLKKTKGKTGLVTKAAAKELKLRQAELLLAQERFKEAEKRVTAIRLVSRKIDDDILESESEEYFWKRRLDDLL
ncbi:UNVERIFIED_CONTAM: hypothetical protein Sangu_2062600 [Sesamum angustifolium]|uniref:Phospholipase-like protein n=1 Tax=Sesamum angustifolium TaxID=2727405 RepID=A0AAW2LIZ6_9LAMI